MIVFERHGLWRESYEPIGFRRTIRLCKVAWMNLEGSHCRVFIVFLRVGEFHNLDSLLFGFLDYIFKIECLKIRFITRLMTRTAKFLKNKKLTLAHFGELNYVFKKIRLVFLASSS